ncbi:response regulator [Terrimonas rubra]|uniref:Response regulator n=1 Tax=Terrimonas rubra TaxID=1035890 RepID=A0ABW6A6H8_9BACT
MKTTTSILIVEDEAITAQDIAELLEDEDYIIEGIAADAATALQLCSKAKQPPQVVICDINIKGNIKGTELALQLKTLYKCQVIFLTAYADNRTLQTAFGTDPVMYLVKPYNNTQLLVAVQMAFHKLLALQKITGSTQLDLTEREEEVARLVAQGFTSKQIARKLAISIETVKTHRRRMLQKNNLNNFPHLIYLLNQTL